MEELTAEQNKIADIIIRKVKHDLQKEISPVLQDRIEKLEQKEHQWHEISMKQLSFFNNLLIVLGVGFLGYAFKDANLAQYEFGGIFHIQFIPTLITSTFLLVTISILTGLLCGYNRLFDFRYTYQIAKLKREYFKHPDADPLKKFPNIPWEGNWYWLDRKSVV